MRRRSTSPTNAGPTPSPISPPTRSSPAWSPAFCSPPTPRSRTRTRCTWCVVQRRIPTRGPSRRGRRTPGARRCSRSGCRMVRRRSCRGQATAKLLRNREGVPGERAQLEVRPGHGLDGCDVLVQLPRVGDADRDHGAVRQRPGDGQSGHGGQGLGEDPQPRRGRDARGRQRPCEPELNRAVRAGVGRRQRNGEHSRHRSGARVAAAAPGAADCQRDHQPSPEPLHRDAPFRLAALTSARGWAVSGAPVACTQARKSPRSNLPLLFPSWSRSVSCAAVSALDPLSSWETTSTVLKVSRNTARTEYGRPIGSVTLKFFVTVSPAHPWNVRTTLVSVAVRVTGVPSATNVPLGTEPEMVPPLVLP